MLIGASLPFSVIFVLALYCCSLWDGLGGSRQWNCSQELRINSSIFCICTLCTAWKRAAASFLSQVSLETKDLTLPTYQACNLVFLCWQQYPLGLALRNQTCGSPLTPGTPCECEIGGQRGGGPVRAVLRNFSISAAAMIPTSCAAAPWAPLQASLLWAVSCTYEQLLRGWQ